MSTNLSYKVLTPASQYFNSEHLTSVEIKNLEEPIQQPTKSYIDYLIEGAEFFLNNMPFGLPWQNGEIRYNSKFWSYIPPESNSENPYLLLRNKVKPSDAFNDILKHPTIWRIDCALLIQLSHYYAAYKTLGDTSFNNVFETGYSVQPYLWQLLQQGATAILPNYLLLREDENHPFQYISYDSEGKLIKSPAPDVSVDELLKNAQIGSRILWRAKLSVINTVDPAFQNENALKIGDDLYIAYINPKKQMKFTRSQLEATLAEETKTPADSYYVRTIEEIKQIK